MYKDYYGTTRFDKIKDLGLYSDKMLPDVGSLSYIKDYCFDLGLDNINYQELKAWSELTFTHLKHYEARAIIDLLKEYKTNIAKTDSQQDANLGTVVYKDTIPPYNPIELQNAMRAVRSARIKNKIVKNLKK